MQPTSCGVPVCMTKQLLAGQVRLASMPMAMLHAWLHQQVLGSWLSKRLRPQLPRQLHKHYS